MQFNKMLINLDIELAGMQARYEAIQKAIARQMAIREKKGESGTDRDKLILKLEEMLVELTIELETAEARQGIVIKIQNKAKEYLDQYRQIDKLPKSIKNLKGGIRTKSRYILFE